MKKISCLRSALFAATMALSMTISPNLMAQVFPPGGFAIDGIPVACGPLPTILTTNIPDAAMNNGQAILINPAVVGTFPHVLKLWAYAHECGHAFVGANEIGADCWAVTTGKHQGWFPPQAFSALIQLFGNNPGNLNHPPGPVRIQAMLQCYQSN
ncbi:hypothetical protein [Paraburkholderia sp. HP33-1]|uniref:hypothetical protein n=1 Tax=Paraburkholderia sp. HP33-1 TaxID=2883243 RepID=UPI001F476EDC|nr:hypothetical protein [Paraburkholderia sp. HP33-1]